MIAGLAGRTAQAVSEAHVARDLGYHAGLLSLAAMKGASEDELIAHCRNGRARRFRWSGSIFSPRSAASFCRCRSGGASPQIENVVAIKIAPFNRYRTLDVVRGVVEAGAADRITLYTGNDDHIVLDLVTPFTVDGGRRARHGADQGRAARALERVGEDGRRTARRASMRQSAPVRSRPICSRSTRRSRTATRRSSTSPTTSTACICGCHEILRRQGLLEGIWCLDPHETLGPGQMQEIDRVCATYPHLADDAFVRANVARWLE